MKIHRFYVGDTIELDQNIWVNDEGLLHQWVRVLRFKPGQQVVLFNSVKEERLYKIDKINSTAAHLMLVTEMSAKTPEKELYLCFALLKKDKNNWVLQKATELGVRHFVPIITSRTEKTGFDTERAHKIVIEAAEQCGRADIPSIREPIKLQTALQELHNKTHVYIAEQGKSSKHQHAIGKDVGDSDHNSTAVFVGPEGGWTNEEKQMFVDLSAEHIALGLFTLRAETASVAAAALLA